MPEFRDVFGADPTHTAAAPGRVNLIGEHTDYNGGFVLPTPIPQHTRVELRPRADGSVRAYSTHGPAGVEAFVLGSESPRHAWVDYVQGAAVILRAEGHRLGGFDVWVDSRVPVGSGLSSSAALGVALMRALRAAFGLSLDDRQIAILVQRVENRFVGAQVGIMDPMVCSLGRPDAALFLDARDLSYELIPVPPGVELVVIDSGVSHRHAGGDYNTRRAECEEACRLLGVGQLRDLGDGDLARVNALPAPFDRRARHVVTENARVLAAVAAMRSGDAAALGRLFDESHDSQRDDYQVSVPEVDALVERARQDPDVYGARLTGGGFGGSIVALAKVGRGRAAGERIVAGIGADVPRPTVLVPPG